MKSSATQRQARESVTMPEISSIRSSTSPDIECGSASITSDHYVKESTNDKDDDSGKAVLNMTSSPQPHRMSTAMEDFLSTMTTDDGGVRPSPFMEGHHRISKGLESIFETSFDLTEERLRRLFNMFDKDKSGSLSYDEMKHGLKYHGLGSFAEDDTTFDQLLRHLDKDGSGSVTFEEFSEGIRLLMLRSLLQSAMAIHGDEKNLGVDDAVLTEIIDYNPTRLERSVLEGFGQDTKGIIPSSSVTSLNVIDFLFEDRPEWINVRWINITGKLSVSLSKDDVAVLRGITSHFYHTLHCPSNRRKSLAYHENISFAVSLAPTSSGRCPKVPQATSEGGFLHRSLFHFGTTFPC
jgi:Ca2+-binding EF-hand superfamily protein